MAKPKLDPSKEAIVFDCYIDRKVTLWMRDKYRITAETKKQAIKKLKEIAKTPEYDSPEFIETETLFDTEEPVTKFHHVKNETLPVLACYVYNEKTQQDEEFIV